MNKTIQVKMDILAVFNQMIDFLNGLDEQIVPKEMQVLDIKAEMLMARLRSIAQRALEINDEKIIDELLCLGIIKGSRDD